VRVEPRAQQGSVTNKSARLRKGIGDHMGVLAVMLIALLALIVVASFVIAVRRNPSWPRKPHVGHWRKWDEDD
jgi:hypothetical protein